MKPKITFTTKSYLYIILLMIIRFFYGIGAWYFLRVMISHEEISNHDLIYFGIALSITVTIFQYMEIRRGKISSRFRDSLHIVGE